jgi:NAD(P)H-dependent FMN reductase
MLKIGIIIGSVRPGRVGETVARWVFDQASQRKDANFELVDLKDFNLPIMDEPIPPSVGKYTQPHTKRWSERIRSFDAFVFVTPEYHHGIPGALKNALDFLYAEWNNKAAGFVSYGAVGGVRAVEQLRLVLAELQVATVRGQVSLSLYTDFENFRVFTPTPPKAALLSTMLDQLVAWGAALKTLRTSREALTSSPPTTPTEIGRARPAQLNPPPRQDADSLEA